MRTALQALAVWLGLVAVFGFFWTLMKAMPDEPEYDDHDDYGPPDTSGPPPSGA